MGDQIDEIKNIQENWKDLELIIDHSETIKTDQ